MEKLTERRNRWSSTIKFHEKILMGAIFLLAPASNHGWYKPFFYWLNETSACCFFGADLGKGLDQYSLSRSTHGTPHSCSDLLCFTLLLLLTWTNYFKSNSISPFCFFGQKFPKSNSSSLLSSDENILSPISISQKYSKSIPQNHFSFAKIF